MRIQRRAWAFGEALRRACDEAPERIALVGTGGISHWPVTPDSGKINEAWDRAFLRQWSGNDRDAMLSYTDEATYRDAGQGGFEIRTFIATAAAARGSGTVRFDAPIPIFSVGCTVATMTCNEGEAMPHLTIQYTANLDPEARIGMLCASLAEVLCGQRDDAGERVFPIGGTRVLAYPAAAFAVADGAPDRAFVYLNVRIAPGRAPHLVATTGGALMDAVRCHFAALLATRSLGITLQVDEGAPVFEAKHGNLHPLFAGR